MLDLNDPLLTIEEMSFEGDFDSDDYHLTGISKWEDPDTGKIPNSDHKYFYLMTNFWFRDRGIFSFIVIVKGRFQHST